MSATPGKPRVEDRDSELIRAISSGRSDLFDRLVEKYEGRLYNFGLRMCRDTTDAEDLVQETFLNVFRYLPRFRYETRFKNWLYRIATSVCLKRKRRSRYAPERELSLEEFLPGKGDELPSRIPAWASRPLEQVLNEELAKRIREAISELPEKYRMVMVLRDIEGFSTDETSQIMEISLSSVKVRLHRARLFVREQLKDYFSNDPP